MTLHIEKFNQKVKAMNQTNSKQLVLSKIEAQNLQADIFALLVQIADLTSLQQVVANDQNINVEVQGGQF